MTNEAKYATMQLFEKTMVMQRKLYSVDKPLVMGILNVTPDSFFDGGRYVSDEAVVQRARDIVAEGADIIDLGAVSTRPGAETPGQEAELRRLLPALRMLRAEFPHVPISIDTFRASVAEECVKAGADIINDISGGLFDDRMFPAIAALQVPYVLMHNRTTPDRMAQATQYTDVVAEVIRFLSERLETLYRLGAKDVVIDPGFGFAKTLDQNYELMRRLDEFAVFDEPLLVGISRKSMIYKLLGNTPDEVLAGTTALNTYALLHGAKILRVHDVAEAVQCRTIVSKLIK